MTERSLTLLEAINLTRDFFRTRGIENPRLDAEILLAHVLGCERIDLYVNFDRHLDSDARARYRELVRRRAAREPLQYLTGVVEFMSLRLRVNENTMIPRPETELLVETAIGILHKEPEAKNVLDIGTGCGNIAVAIAHALPSVRVFATDISRGALAVARKNAESLGVGDRITFLEGDLFEPLKQESLYMTFDMVVSNPPYVSISEKESLAPEVAMHEPAVAIFAGEDGAYFHKRIIFEGKKFLTPGGTMILEVGAGQADTVAALFLQDGAYCDIEKLKDYGGVERIVMARRRS